MAPKKRASTGGGLAPLHLTTAAAQLLGHRKTQEDSYVIRSRGSDQVIWVADGVGGHPHGDKASAAAVKAAAAAVLKAFGTDEQYPETALQYAFARAHEHVSDLAKGQFGALHPATTLVGGFISTKHRTASFANIGDSLAYRYYEGELSLLFDPQGEGHRLDHALGFDAKRDLARFVKCETIRLMPNDRILLATDGIVGIGHDGLIDSLTEATPEAACANLLDQVQRLDHPHQDNATVVVVFLDALISSLNTVEKVLSRVVQARNEVRDSRGLKKDMLDDGLLLTESESHRQEWAINEGSTPNRHRPYFAFDAIDERGPLLPAFQFEPKIASQCRRIIAMMPGYPAWARYRFFTTPLASLGGWSPLDKLRADRFEEVVDALEQALGDGDVR